MNKEKFQKDLLLFVSTLLFIFISIALRSHLISSSYMIPILIFVVYSIREKSIAQKIFGFIVYTTFLIQHFTGLIYNGFFSTIVGCILLSGIFYIYEDQELFSANEGNKIVKKKHRFITLLFIFLGFIAISIPYAILHEIWQKSFLEIGGETAFVFGTVVGIEYLVEHVGKSLQREEERIKLSNFSYEKKTTSPLIVKILTSWLVILDISILNYAIMPNNEAFPIALFFVILTLLIVTFIRIDSESDNIDVFHYLYNKLRPFQAIALLVLLFSHDKRFTIAFWYVTLVVIIYIVWALGKINTKTLFVAEILILFLPVFGFISNPYRQLSNSYQTISDVLTAKETPIKKDDFSVRNFLSDWLDDNSDNSKYRYQDDAQRRYEEWRKEYYGEQYNKNKSDL